MNSSQVLVAVQGDLRVKIIDRQGASLEFGLTGNGDALYVPPGAPALHRHARTCGVALFVFAPFCRPGHHLRLPRIHTGAVKKISIIIPCYQNQGSIPILADKLIALRDRLADRAQMAVVCVNDGSTDNTLAELMDFKAQGSLTCVKIVNLSRNFGSYNAFLAGMAHSEGDCHVHLHADLQEPPELIEEMFAQYERGTKLVIAYRSAREDTEDVTLFALAVPFLVKRYAIRNVPKGRVRSHLV